MTEPKILSHEGALIAAARTLAKHEARDVESREQED